MTEATPPDNECQKFLVGKQLTLPLGAMHDAFLGDSYLFSIHDLLGRRFPIVCYRYWLKVTSTGCQLKL